MYFVECKESEIEQKHGRQPKYPVTKLIYDFIDAGIRCARLEDMAYKCTDTAYKSFSNIICKEKLSHIKLVMRGSKLYLVNTLIKE